MGNWNWIDIISLVLTILVCLAIGLGVIVVVKGIHTMGNAAQESLKSKGYTVTGHGVAVKTTGHQNREDYVSATQRQIVRAIGAATFGKSVNPMDRPEDHPETAVHVGVSAEKEEGTREHRFSFKRHHSQDASRH
ncbi:hypothetical protein BDN72DRAFT_848466 [Pluteus cervinus]|uniref:Uncharacterized protein n=1 Tax=Pluteus cervinus TaxID=181527 RepID=A0ACD3AAR1_9AGAR|nr:hypothetical protein BDN72DRAFT_848466 [Pluteus cervinus]